MSKIKTYARIKPSESLYDDFDCTKNRLYLRIPDTYSRDTTLYNKTRVPIVNHEFKYTEVFGTQSTQEEIYNKSAKSIIDGFLDGYNGTIFAYGQTSSGKTYTMQGDLNDEVHKGITPRGLSQIFAAVNQKRECGESITVQVSFLEIYQEVGFDLLKIINKGSPAGSSLSKVTVVDGLQGSAVVKNLSFHTVNTEDAAQNLLAQGEHNRKVAETAMNNRSSRSHAVFTVYLSSRKGDLVNRSKMHFVDLAGSERVCKTGVKGLQLSEAKYINLSLHYLEGVIIALNQEANSAGRIALNAANVSKSWSSSPLAKRPFSAADGSGRPRHIPYRNSLLTMLLKDSLGGNCLTSMIATVSFELDNLSETVSTCRFAQRVSSISNSARRNEEVDDKSMIKRLRTRVAELEAENNILKHGGTAESSFTDESAKPGLSSEEKELCKQVVSDFLVGKLNDPVVAGVTDPFKFRECMGILKRLIKDYNEKSLKLVETLKKQPHHVQESYYTGGRFHEAPLAQSSVKQEIKLRDDSNVLLRGVYNNVNKGKTTILKPTILKPNEGSRKDPLEDAWQMQLQGNVGVAKSAPHSRVLSNGSAPPAKRVDNPYEKKKTQEIMNLNKQIEDKSVQQMHHANHLLAFKMSVVEQEMEINEAAVRNKLQQAMYQLHKQQRTVLELQKQSADADLLEQEELVESQLQKRVIKLSEELKDIINQIKNVRSSPSAKLEEPNTTSSKSVHQKFSDMVRRDGSLDTVKVKSTLQEQQKIQKNFDKLIQQHRVEIIERQMEVKENATRQKLEELKQRLLETKEHSSDGPLSANQTSIFQQESIVSKNEFTNESPIKVNHSNSGATSSKHSGTNGMVTLNHQTVNHSNAMLETYLVERMTANRKPISDKVPNKVATTDEKSEFINQGGNVEVQQSNKPLTSNYVNHSNQHNNQSTISPNPSMQVAESSPSAIEKILEKYREQVPGYSAEKRRQTTAEVNRIMETYKAKEKRGFGDKGDSKGPNKVPGRAEENIPEYVKIIKSGHYKTISVPKSAMVFQTTTLNPAETRESSKQSRNRNQQEAYVHQQKYEEKDFQATLQAILKGKTGSKKKRTEAWADSKMRREVAATDSRKDLLQKKLQRFLLKQQKAKKATSDMKAPNSKAVSEVRRSANPSKRPSPVAQPNNSRIANSESTYSPSTKEYSHRLSYYHKLAGQNKFYEEAVNMTSSNFVEDKKPVEPTDNLQELAPPHMPTALEGLRKLTQRHEHTNKIRQAQDAALKIQQAWKRYSRNREEQ